MRNIVKQRKRTFLKSAVELMGSWQLVIRCGCVALVELMSFAPACLDSTCCSSGGAVRMCRGIKHQVRDAGLVVVPVTQFNMIPEACHDSKLTCSSLALCSGHGEGATS